MTGLVDKIGVGMINVTYGLLNQRASPEYLTVIDAVRIDLT